MVKNLSPKAGDVGSAPGRELRPHVVQGDSAFLPQTLGPVTPDPTRCSPRSLRAARKTQRSQREQETRADRQGDQGTGADRKRDPTGALGGGGACTCKRKGWPIQRVTLTLSSVFHMTVKLNLRFQTN